MRRHSFFCSALCLGIMIWSNLAEAGIIYVDSRTGNDQFDGKAAKPLGSSVGPLRSLRGALSRAKPGDTIELANNGSPYFGSATLSGGRHSALGHIRMIIEGNGAVIDGSQPVPPHAWREVANRIWKVTPWRKGHYQLVLEDSPLPEYVDSSGSVQLDEIPEGHWAAKQGSIYYRAALGEYPPEGPFRFARHSVGLTLYGVRGVTIRNLTVRHFRLDGISAVHDCHDVELENVQAVGNGRTGVAVGGGAQVVVRNSKLADNREHQLLITGLGAAEVFESELSQPPTIVD